MAKSKWSTPLEKMIASEKKSTLTVDELTRLKLAKKNQIVDVDDNNVIGKTITIDPNSCKRWLYKDRPATELGDLDELAESIKQHGQIQPGTIRPNNADDSNIYPYEIIIGERRWLACKQAGLTFNATLRELTDEEAAIIQVAENDKRKDLSDYARFCSYNALIQGNVISREDLHTKLDKSKSYIRNLFSFGRISKELSEAIGDLSNLSARTAYEVARYEEKGTDYKTALFKIAPTLGTTKVGEKQLERLIQSQLKSIKNFKQSTVVTAKDGRHYFTWRNDSNGNRSISFPKTIRDKINFNQLEKVIEFEIQQQLSGLSVEKLNA